MMVLVPLHERRKQDPNNVCRSDRGSHRNPIHWSQQPHSSLAKRLLNRAEATATPPQPGPQAIAKLQIDQMMSVLENISSRINELSKPRDIKQNVDTLFEHVRLPCTFPPVALPPRPRICAGIIPSAYVEA
jgi:hypothetical protein